MLCTRFFSKSKSVTIRYRGEKEVTDIMRYLKWSTGVLLILLTSCAFIKIPLFPEKEGLQEQVLEGQGKAKILLVEVSGIISEKPQSKGLGLAEEASLVSRIKEELQKAEGDRDVVGIILRINSPGGTVSATDIVYHELMQFKNQRDVKVIACVTGLAASGGYYIASAADQIVAHPTSIVGSIGVIAMKLNVNEFLSKIGIQEETIKSVDKKDIWSPLRPSTPEETAIIQTIIDAFHERFVAVVLAGRGSLLSEKELEKIADGRIFTADQAVAVKLVDRIGYLDDAVKEMKDFFELEEAQVVTYYRSGSYKGTIYSAFPQAADKEINVIAIDGDSVSLGSGVQFMYLWKP
jgi:protease-4